MTNSIKRLFELNTRLIGDLDKAVINFRINSCDKALTIVADSLDPVKASVDAIIKDREYFNLVSIDSILEMLSSILDAQKNKDYILLADLLELQLISFLCGVQELIISKEEILFDEDKYVDNLKLLKEYGKGFSDKILGPVNSSGLLKMGYRVEFTSCGLMTLVAENKGQMFYFHTNNQVISEACLLARHWFKEDKRHYVLYGFGMGYHVNELSILAPTAEITVYESDINVLKLACAFTDMDYMKDRQNITVVYDPEFCNIKEQISKQNNNSEVDIHYPSFLNIRNKNGILILKDHTPWSEILESC